MNLDVISQLLEEIENKYYKIYYVKFYSDKSSTICLIGNDEDFIHNYDYQDLEINLLLVLSGKMQLKQK